MDMVIVKDKIFKTNFLFLKAYIVVTQKNRLNEMTVL